MIVQGPSQQSPLQSIRDAAATALARLRMQGQDPASVIHSVAPPGSPLAQQLGAATGVQVSPHVGPQGAPSPTTAPMVGADAAAVAHPQTAPMVGADAGAAAAMPPVDPRLVAALQQAHPDSPFAQAVAQLQAFQNAHQGPETPPAVGPDAVPYDHQTALEDALHAAVNDTHPPDPRLLASLAAELEARIDPRTRLAHIARTVLGNRMGHVGIPHEPVNMPHVGPPPLVDGILPPDFGPPPTEPSMNFGHPLYNG